MRRIIPAILLLFVCLPAFGQSAKSGEAKAPSSNHKATPKTFAPKAPAADPACAAGQFATAYDATVPNITCAQVMWLQLAGPLPASVVLTNPTTSQQIVGSHSLEVDGPFILVDPAASSTSLTVTPQAGPTAELSHIGFAEAGLSAFTQGFATFGGNTGGLEAIVEQNNSTNGFSALMAVNEDSTNANAFTGIMAIASSTNAAAGPTQQAIGVNAIAMQSVNGNASDLEAVVAQALVEGTGTIGTANAIETQSRVDVAGATVTTLSGIHVQGNGIAAGATVTNNYGILIEPQTSGTNNVGLYVNGNANENSLQVHGGNIFIDSGVLRIGPSCQIIMGGGNPNGQITATQCSLFLRTDGGAGATLYVKESGTNNNVGWVAK